VIVFTQISTEYMYLTTYSLLSIELGLVTCTNPLFTVITILSTCIVTCNYVTLK